MDYDCKLQMYQKIYIVFGDPKKQIILSAYVCGVHITNSDFKNQEVFKYYTYDHIKLVRSKAKVPHNFEANLIACGSVDEKYVDMKSPQTTHPIGMSNWPVFTSKECCINYLRRFKNG